jgi:hypothetical protein
LKTSYVMKALTSILFLVSLHMYAQIGPSPINSINTWRVEEVYSTGQAVIRNGVIYQSLVSNNVAYDPAGTTGDWTTVLGSSASSGVSSITNSDSTLTITPTTGAAVASINLGNGNTWTGIQNFSAINATSTGATTPGTGAFTTLAATGGITATSDGVHAGYESLVGNTANQAVTTNTAGFMGPNLATFTGWACQLPSAAPSGGQAISCGTPTSGVAAGTWVTYAPLASPTFTGTPAAPTASALTNTTQIATTANVVASIPANTTAFTNAQTAPSFNPQSGAAGPNSVYFNDFYYNADVVAAGIGSPSGNGCNLVGALDVNHPGVIEVLSGTGGTGSGIACIVGNQQTVFAPQSTAWTWETVVKPVALPGTTAGSFQAGLVTTENANPWTTGIGFYLSSANGNANHWYCRYGSTSTDSTVSATTAWHRLTIVNNLTNVLWSVDGVQVCSVAVASVPSTNMFVSTWTATALSGTGIGLYVDYLNFINTVTR